MGSWEDPGTKQVLISAQSMAQPLGQGEITAKASESADFSSWSVPGGIQGSELTPQVAGEGRATALNMGWTAKPHFEPSPSLLIILDSIRDHWEEEKGFERGNKATHENGSMTSSSGFSPLTLGQLGRTKHFSWL